MIQQNLQPENIAEQILQQLIDAADKEHASDIHIDPRGDEVAVRFRTDGLLKEISKFEMSFLEPITSRLKVMTQLDITNHSTPQEGPFEWLMMPARDKPQEQRVLDIRVSFFPTIYGESIVMRILNRAELLIPLSQIGFSARDQKLVETLLTLPYGMVLASGPAGAGKTTLLYAILNKLILPEKNIITLEDPVEYHFKNIRQSQIHPERGFTFDSGMRSILRQDPDIVMIGEIRDPITLETAINASLTGRLLFSSIHANSSIGTIARILDMKIDPSLIAYALNGVIAQRLVRRVCQSCKTPDAPDQKALLLLGLPQDVQLFKGAGCSVCSGSGYKGRLGIFEILVIDNDMRRAIVDHKQVEEINTIAKEKGLKTLREDGLEKIKAGLTTVEELMRISI